jgi:hypothetical protein
LAITRHAVDTLEATPLDARGWTRRCDLITIPDTGSGPPPIVDMGALELHPPARPDVDHDGDVDEDDFERLSACWSGAGIAAAGACLDTDFDGDEDVDQSDFAIFQGCLSGSEPAAPDCAS